MAFADWSESEAQRRIATLLRCGWRPAQLAAMFGIEIEEIDRLAGAFDQPRSTAGRGV
jgi:hypothetical protein